MVHRGILVLPRLTLTLAVEARRGHGLARDPGQVGRPLLRTSFAGKGQQGRGGVPRAALRPRGRGQAPRRGRRLHLLQDGERAHDGHHVEAARVLRVTVVAAVAGLGAVVDLEGGRKSCVTRFPDLAQ